MELKDDLIVGAAKIAEFRGESERRTYHLLESGQLPGAFKMGGRWNLLKSTHMARLEQEAADAMET